MKAITLKKDGTIFVETNPAEKIDPLCHLGDPIFLAEGYCLSSFFSMLKTYPVLQRFSEFFPGMMDRYRAITSRSVEYLGADWIEFGKTVEMIGFPGEPRLEIFNAVRSISEDDPIEIRSIDLSGLLNVPLTLGKLRHIILGDRVDVFEFDTTYTLFEFIDGIAWELGFHTMPGECNIRR